MTPDPTPLTAEIGVGSLVRFRTATGYDWVVVKVCGWPLRGRLKIRRRTEGGCTCTEGGCTFTEYAYPAELELVEGGE